MILVTGASGKTGKAVIAALAAKGQSVRALIRGPEHAAMLKALGAADVHIGSFEDNAALVRAASGTRAIYHICPNVSAHEVDYASAVVIAAKTAGVRRLVYHSVLHPQIEAMPHHWLKMRAEELLFAAGLDLTVLQPTAYMQNILGVWSGIVAERVFRTPYPTGTRLSLVDLEDVAEAAAVVLTSDDHLGASYELVGTPAITQTEVAAAMTAALGREVRAEEETIAAWDARARASGMGDYERATLTAMFRYYAAHGLIGNSNPLAWLLDRAPHDLAYVLRRAAADVTRPRR
jgi:NAD(P)H dehydrogenase (quinone)